ncbi:hypothetical protein B0H17DRAFT_954526 [Mycena rosella]|uniref:BTB domain-containing protein n=1 Tax=Mycena rosella TaxID=1033263 RepID=A0AAD7G675_MYCRO|nr:hypothetical protein B0H17DRAFT_954526 [Mycena rosella]
MDVPLPNSPPGSLLDESDHDDELWFSDGTLGLSAGRSSFRVYGGLLAKRSLVFHDMLQFPQPDDADVVDGCPMVHLQDNEADPRSFLNALFDYQFFPPFPEKTTFDILAGVIRLSTKYQVESLRKRALGHPLSSFPFTVDEYPGTPSLKIPDHEWIRVVNFAREMSID